MAAAVPCRMASVSEELEIKYDADVEVRSLLGAVVESEEEVFLEDGDGVDAVSRRHTSTPLTTGSPAPT